MSGAVHDNWTYAMKHNMNFRDACLVNAMNKIYQHYGMWSLFVIIRLNSSIFIYFSFIHYIDTIFFLY